MKSFAFFGLLMLSASVISGPSSGNYYRVFWNPTLNGQRLAYCLSDQNQCGKVVADAYCNQMGYPSSNEHVRLYNAGLTFNLDGNQRCKGWECSSFKMIRCKAKIERPEGEDWHYQYHKFVYPRWQNYRIDWCYDGQKNCGRKAAFSFCRRLGYLDVRSYKIQENLGATKAIGNDKLCFMNGCRGFSVINCKR